MIGFEEALDIVSRSAKTLDVEQIDFNLSNARVLAEDVQSDIDMPPFDKSAMDGYACRFENLKNPLEVIEVIPAGKPPKKTIGKNQCSKIMTGSKVPEGADCVIMVEQTEELPGGRIRFTAEKTKSNFVPKGEDVKRGDVVLKRGTLIKAQHIAVMASVGCILPMVYRKARIGVLSTGDELVEPSVFPGESKIRNSNAYQLLNQAAGMGCEANYYGIALDNEEHSRKLIQKTLKENDMVLLTGGVSMGDFDFIPKVFQRLNIDILFDSVAVQPGRPTVYGISGHKYIFGLPGNPVSSFNIFELLVKPLLYKIMGHDFVPVRLRLPLGKEYKRKKSTRKSYLPVQIDEQGRVIPIQYHGSAHVHALVFADGLISIPVGKTTLNKGELVDVRQI
ncbi:MAG: molybdopterin molybdotransferase MoeA [Bacteroidales bacterium]|nr:molybdopterin molybdotransferase MoeA [Bacteroidales bacterium]MCF8343781.1 molybdopterin molybdotransferase MoeA [Bacteroidales bacterium]MCF8350295.1 molybdopterin molybdotransferase MoeA [Bacteroidales bacterium]MCF8374734.1 molybdopterin molybdotransferase MoeA [Bacteroidales bacterium]MCF8399862.1 molybdopterin molybdotransferase MoeA [Bacteroidales bacterium]